MTRLGVGLIGLGRHGLRYVKHLLEDLPEVRLVAVSRRDASQGQAFADARGLRFYQDYRGVIADDTVEVVVAVTPPSLNLRIGREAIRAGKPVLIEKPLARTGHEARELVEVATAAKVPIMTAHTLRFDAAIRMLKQRQAEAGAPRYVVLTQRGEPRPEVVRDADDYGGRGVLLEIGVHLLDQVRFLTDDEVAEVRCSVVGAAGAGPEHQVLACLYTRGGVPCVVDVSRVSASRAGHVEWIGSDHQLIADWIGRRFTKLSPGGHREEQATEEQPTVLGVLRAFLGALQTRGSMPISGLDGQRAVELADACYESAATGKPVRVA